MASENNDASDSDIDIEETFGALRSTASNSSLLNNVKTGFFEMDFSLLFVALSKCVRKGAVGVACGWLRMRQAYELLWVSNNRR